MSSSRKTPSKAKSTTHQLTTQSAQFVKPTNTSGKKSLVGLVNTPALSTSPSIRRTALGQLQPNLMPPATIATSNGSTKPIKRVFIIHSIVFTIGFLLFRHDYYFEHFAVVVRRDRSKVCIARSSTRMDVDRADPHIHWSWRATIVTKVLKSLLRGP